MGLEFDMVIRETFSEEDSCGQNLVEDSKPAPRNSFSSAAKGRVGLEICSKDGYLKGILERWR